MKIKLFKISKSFGSSTHDRYWCELTLGGYTGVRFSYWQLCVAGLWFPYKGDEVLWCWPWRRESGYRYISLMCEGGFNSLKDIDQFWIDYEKACSK